MNKPVLILDGAAGTLLEAQGITMHPKLWSAAAIVEAPDAVRKLHAEYFAAGANIATSLTYQASIPGYVDNLGVSKSKAATLMTEAVLIAKEEARNAKSPALRFVAAGLGPYGAYLCLGQEYSGEYGDVTYDELKTFHAPRVAAVMMGDPDFLLFETIPNIMELRVIVEIVRLQRIQIPVWVALSVKKGEAGFVLADGTSLEDVSSTLPADIIRAVGANCFALSDALEVVDALQIFERPLILYPNSGEIYDGERGTWSATTRVVGEWEPAKWAEKGVRVVGGCCRTGPAEIKRVSQLLRSNQI